MSKNKTPNNTTLSHWSPIPKGVGCPWLCRPL